VLFDTITSQIFILNNDMPRALVDNNGWILKSNNVFHRYIASARCCINNVISIYTYEKMMIGITQDAIWRVESTRMLRILNIFHLSFTHIAMINTWSDSPFSMAWVDSELKILACNKKFNEEFGGAPGDFIKKYLIGLNKSMLANETVMQIKSGREYYRLFIQADENELFLLTIENISELCSLQSQVADDKQMVVIGHAASSVIHDFRNILTVMSGYCDIGLSGSAIPSLQKISDACKSAQDLVEDLLSLIKNRNQYARMCNPSILFDKIKDSLCQITNNIINMDAPDYHDIAYVPISDTALERIVTNIVLNAYEAVSNHDTPQINLKLDKIFFPKTWTNLDCEMLRGWYVCISCTDNGPGISEDKISEVFKPFYTSKPNGNGLGLSSALIAIKEAGGGMNVLSRQNIKTRFDIYLPIIQQIKIKDEPISQQTTEVVRPKLFTSTKHILIVEDNEDVLKLCSMTLRKEGYDVLEACNAEDAIRLCTKHTVIDLLITDLNMPGMDGLSMICKIQETLPLPNILIVSGYDRDLLEKRNMKFPEHANFMLKPMKLLDLRTKVHNIFNHGQG
jgi:signal transduction histidine kinase